MSKNKNRPRGNARPPRRPITATAPTAPVEKKPMPTVTATIDLDALPSLRSKIRAACGSVDTPTPASVRAWLAERGVETPSRPYVSSVVSEWLREDAVLPRSAPPADTTTPAADPVLIDLEDTYAAPAAVVLPAPQDTVLPIAEDAPTAPVVDTQDTVLPGLEDSVLSAPAPVVLGVEDAPQDTVLADGPAATEDTGDPGAPVLEDTVLPTAQDTTDLGFMPQDAAGDGQDGVDTVVPPVATVVAVLPVEDAPAPAAPAAPGVLPVSEYTVLPVRPAAVLPVREDTPPATVLPVREDGPARVLPLGPITEDTVLPAPAPTVLTPPTTAPVAGVVAAVKAAVLPSGQDTPKPERKQVPIWPVLLLCLPAFVAIWSGWVELGAMCGFGLVRPLPGMADDLTINVAITLPIGVEAYAAYALMVWLSGRAYGAAKTFAKVSAIGALILGGLGQTAFHLLASNPDADTIQVQRGEEWVTQIVAPWPITAVVACLPVLVLGMGAALAHMVRHTAPTKNPKEQ